MNDRQIRLLDIIIREYVETSEPIGSLTIVNKYDFNVSPATIRLEMGYLEKEDYIYQPHTSAGRIPTDKGYRWFVNYTKHKEAQLSKREKEALRKALSSFSDMEKAVKMAAHLLSEMTYCGALATLSTSQVYYHGITNMFRQPEFEDRFMLLGFADLLDHLNEFIMDLPKIEQEVIYIGRENPYLRKAGCSMIVSPYKNKEIEGFLGLLGPTRMSYEKNLLLLDFMTTSLNEMGGK